MQGRRVTSIIAVSLILIAALPVLLTAYAAGKLVATTADVGLKSTLEVLTKAISLKAEESLKPAYDTVDSLAIYIATHGENADPSAFMEAVQRARTEIVTIILLNEAGHILEISPRNKILKGDDLSGQPEYAKAQKTEGVVFSRPFVSPFDGSVTVSAYRKMGRYMGVVQLDLEHISRSLDRLRFSPNDHVAIVDGDGRVIAHSDLAIVFEQDYEKNIPSSRVLTRAIHNGEDYIAMARDVLGTPWRAIYFRLESETQALEKSLIRTLGLITAIAITSAVMAAIAINRSLTRPFSAIIVEAKAIADGHYDRRIAGSWPVELESIAGAFNQMAESVERRDQELQESEEQLRKDRDEKTVLLKEVHHRVKNNLQIIASLLHLQSNYIKSEEDQELFHSSENRVYSMSLTHELLYQSANLSSIDMAEYTERLISYLLDGYPIKGLKFETSIGHFALPLERALPCGLILNELVTNALKYATKGSAFPRIDISLHIVPPSKGSSEKGRVLLEVRDRGPGLPVLASAKSANSLGFSLIQSLVNQLDGTIQWLATDPSAENQGLTARVEFGP